MESPRAELGTVGMEEGERENRADNSDDFEYRRATVWIRVLVPN